MTDQTKWGIDMVQQENKAKVHTEQKAMRDDEGVISDEKQEALAYELGDILWALARLVDDLGLDFAKIAERNIAKLEDRKKRNVISGSGDKR